MPPGYRTLWKHMTCIKVIIQIISQIGQKVHKTARNGTIVSVSSKSLYECITAWEFNKNINPYKMDIQYIQHAYELHIGVGIKF